MFDRILALLLCSVIFMLIIITHCVLQTEHEHIEKQSQTEKPAPIIMTQKVLDFHIDQTQRYIHALKRRSNFLEEEVRRSIIRIKDLEERLSDDAPVYPQRRDMVLEQYEPMYAI